MEPVQMQSSNQDAVVEYARLKRRNRVIGLLWLIIPMATLPIILSAYAIASFAFAQLSPAAADIGVVTLGEEDARVASFAIMRVVLGILGIVAVLGIMVGVPIGIIYLSKRVMVPGTKFDERSGNGDASVVPEEIKGWNWGAAGLIWIWGASHRVWISFICLIPVVGLVFRFILGVYGSEWAWKAEKWESVEAFKKTQDKWKPWGIVFFVLSMLGIVSRLSNFGELMSFGR